MTSIATRRPYVSPGPGTWEQDSTHVPRPMTSLMFEAFREPFSKGFREGTARYGLLFSHLEPAQVNNFVYYRKAGQLTPLQFYIDCYQRRGQPILLDDVEPLLENKIGAKLVSALGDTTPMKQMSYASTGRAPMAVRSIRARTGPSPIRGWTS